MDPCASCMMVIGRARRHRVHVERRGPRHLHGPVIAPEVVLHSLERVEAHLPVVAGRHLTDGRGPLVAGPVGLQEQVESINLWHIERLKAIPQEDVLLAVLLRDLVAAVWVVRVDAQGLGIEDLDGPVQAQLTVVQPHRMVRLPLRAVGVLQHLRQAIREEHAVWIDLDGPVVLESAAVLDQAHPVSLENRGVEGRVELAANLRLQ
mmetsp:Transcript_118664/g.347607  ORF Transcript_118664/g.347607 Transcript_118664/m.347607 type:complete len:206 (+) Transcript_118664:100-717(+)